MSKKDIVESITKKFQSLLPYLNEKTIRIWAAVESVAIGHGGVSSVSKATGLSRTTIYVGLNESKTEKNMGDFQKIRKTGGGRKKIIDKNSTILSEIKKMIEPMTRGDPESPLLWISKSTTKIAETLRAKGYSISQRTICDILSELGFSLQSNRKTNEGGNHPDRNEQFLHISEEVKAFQNRSQPAISVDAKKKELIGNFKNHGSEWQPKGEPVDVNVYDFIDKELGKVVPYGVYDIAANKGWVNVGIDHDTAEFAVESIRRWWYEMGKLMYPNSTEILITADCGGSNSYRSRLWKAELQKLANELHMTIHICHFPPGTSKWNKIEHRMFSHISNNWRGRPLVSRAVVVNLIGNTKTKNNLEIRAMLDEKTYPLKIKVDDELFKSIAIEKSAFHGEWNYKILPK